jgi:dolichol-phosphate mannosyltransferase
MDLSIILPTYNEVEGIPVMIQHLLDLCEKENIKPEIVVVDDNSPDGTGEVVQKKFAHNSHVKCIVRTEERGLATAVLRGIKETSAPTILLIDADFNHDPKYIPQMYELINKYGYDVANGSRYVWGGDMEGKRGRYYGSYWFNQFLNLLLFIKTSDSTGGYVMLRRKPLERINLKDVFKGYGDFCIRLLYALKLRDVTLIEVPVVYAERHSGESKTFFYKYVFQYTWTAIKLRLSGKKLIKKH